MSMLATAMLSLQIDKYGVKNINMRETHILSCLRGAKRHFHIPSTNGGADIRPPPGGFS